MTQQIDNVFAKAGLNAQELEAIKGRSVLYIGTLAMAGLSLFFAGMTVVNLVA